MQRATVHMAVQFAQDMLAAERAYHFDVFGVSTMLVRIVSARHGRLRPTYFRRRAAMTQYKGHVDTGVWVVRPDVAQASGGRRTFGRILGIHAAYLRARAGREIYASSMRKTALMRRDAKYVVDSTFSAQ